MTSERDLVIRHVGRKFYESFCDIKQQDPWSTPYVPRWARAYAVIATDLLGWDDETLEKIRMEKMNDNRNVALKDSSYPVEAAQLRRERVFDSAS